MADDIKNPGGDSDLEDDFDDLDFDDVDLEDDAVYDDITDEDLESDFGADASEPFDEDEEWEEEEERPQGKKRKKEKSLYTDTSERKSLNLSFNAMVIIGAVLLGGSVLAYTVMNKTAQVNAAKPSIFRSMLSIGDVLDGNIFGSKETATPEQQAAQDPSATPAPATSDQGFLDNPDALPQEQQAVATDEENPPMPSPISPSETDNGQILTPMPRGPEETAAVEQKPAVDPTEQLSAQAIIEQAIANRENKGKPKEADQAPVAIAPEPVVTSEPVIEEATPVLPIPVEPQVAKISAEDEAKMKEAAKRAADAEAQVQALQQQIESMQSQMKNLQGELASARDSKSQETQSVEKTIADLKQQLQEAKTATSAQVEQAKKEAQASAAKQVEQAKKEAAAAEAVAAQAKKDAAKAEAAKLELAKKQQEAKEEAKVASIPAPEKKQTAKKAETKPKPAETAKSTQTASSRWELRAAQPGRAWVSKPGARDMQSVTVGETLPGIGRVTAISYINGRWTVQGTSGQILQ